eukprot:TRINITY_DN49409_c0_g1_i2.p1 TRINITY_DN49409_c0_g1~~TRINITY_DN49409_c0_g1_i2.p1  ORF type:complete len:358 (+),score=54.90 TRINITY_DN49409_c0_g1_i2:63-1076(+)
MERHIAFAGAWQTDHVRSTGLLRPDIDGDSGCLYRLGTRSGQALAAACALPACASSYLATDRGVTAAVMLPLAGAGVAGGLARLRRRRHRRRCNGGRGVRLMAVAEADVQAVRDLFKDVEEELGRHTGLKDDLHYLVDMSREVYERQVADGSAGMESVEWVRNSLTWLRARREKSGSVPQSMGPLAVAAVRHPGTGGQLLIIGTPHTVPALSAEKNPVPPAVQRAIAAFKPDLVGVELDKARGRSELEKLPSELWGRSSLLLPAVEPEPFADPSAGGPPQADEELVRQLSESLSSPTTGEMSADAMLEATRQILDRAPDDKLAMTLLLSWYYVLSKY